MKKTLTVILALLAFALIFTGCATTSDAGEADEPKTLSWNDASTKAGTPDAPVPYTSAAPETPKLSKKASLVELFSNTAHWPDNTSSLPVAMNPAKDKAKWDEFCGMMQSSKTSIDQMESFLFSWYDKYGWTPEFYAACHNFFFAKASDLVSYAASEDDINEVYSILDLCFDACVHGSDQYPERLDLWCGYVHAAFMLGDYDGAMGCILAIFDRMAFNNNNWYWTYNEPFCAEEDREAEFVSIMHDYIAEFLNANELDYAVKTSEKLLEWFMDNTIALNDAALPYLYAGELEPARVYLERAVAIDPSDLIVVTNLAYVCEDLGDYETALKYANDLIMSGEEDYVDRGIRLCAELMPLINPGR